MTGGAGFIGSHTTDLLIQNGHQVTILDNLEPQVHQNKKPNHLNPKAHYIWGDIQHKPDWHKALGDIDTIIHLAALVGVGQSMYQPTRYLNINTIGTANLYETLLQNPTLRKKIKKIIVASSKAIYGEGTYKCTKCNTVHPPPRPKTQLEKHDWEVHCPTCHTYVQPVGITEEKPPQTPSIYALSKYDSEKIALNCGFALNIPTTALRYFNVYGPRQSLNNPYTGLIAIFSSRIKNNHPPIIYEDGHQVRDFIYVEDVATANHLALESEATGVYNVGTGHPTSVLTIAKHLTALHNSKVEPKITNEFRPGDNRHDYADITKIEKELNFKPKWSLKKGLQKLCDWSEKQEARDMFEIAEKQRKQYLDQSD